MLMKNQYFKYAILDGIGYSVMQGMGEYYFPAFYVFLFFSPMELGLIASLPIFVGSLAQIFSISLVNKVKSNKYAAAISVAIQTISYPMLVLAILYGKLSFIYILIFICINWIGLQLSGPPWISLIGMMTEDMHRGVFFGIRNLYQNIAYVIAFLIAGLILKYSQGHNMVKAAFAFIFTVAMFGRLFSLFYLLKYPDLRCKIQKQSMNIKKYLPYIKEKKLYYTMLLIILANVGLYLSFPFYAPYLLDQLHNNYLWYCIITLIPFITRALFSPLWGRLEDKYGDFSVLIVSSFMMAIMPIAWGLAGLSPYKIAFVIPALFSGIAWAGFFVSTLNVLVNATVEENRTTIIAYFNSIQSLFQLAASLLGGLLLKHYPNYIFLFILSGTIGLVPILLFRKKNRMRNLESTEK